MATLYVSSFGGTEKGVASDIIGATTVTTSGTSAATATNGSYLSAGETLWLKVPYGHKIAAITA